MDEVKVPLLHRAHVRSFDHGLQCNRFVELVYLPFPHLSHSLFLVCDGATVCLYPGEQVVKLVHLLCLLSLVNCPARQFKHRAAFVDGA